MPSTLSKLRDLSERHNVPWNYWTRAGSVFIIGLYAYKIGKPFISDNLMNLNKKCDKDDDVSLSLLKNGSNIFNKKKDEGKNEQTHKNEYTDFGPKHFLVDFVVSCLKKFQTITGIDVTSIIQLTRLIHIMVPSVRTMEALLLTLHYLALVSRTFVSIYVAKLEGSVVKYIVRKDVVNFSFMLSKWLLIALPATFINSLIRYLESRVALSFRTRLVKYAYGLYFDKETYYSVSNLDSRLENPDHCLTEDIISFSQHCAHLFSSVSKPLLDICLTSYTLYSMANELSSYGMLTISMVGVVVMLTHGILRWASPKFGNLVAEEARRKGFLRFVHSRVIANAEEIAFYRGHHIESSYVEAAYKSLTYQMHTIFAKKLWYVMLEQFLMKYMWSSCGMVVIALPIMSSGANKSIKNMELFEDISERTQYMTTAKNVLISGADASERLMSSYKDFIELTGYTYRVAKMLTVFEQVSRRDYKRLHISRVNNSLSIELVDGFPVNRGSVIETTRDISLVNVPVITPNCDVVVPSLSFEVS